MKPTDVEWLQRERKEYKERQRDAATIQGLRSQITSASQHGQQFELSPLPPPPPPPRDIVMPSGTTQMSQVTMGTMMGGRNEQAQQ